VGLSFAAMPIAIGTFPPHVAHDAVAVALTSYWCGVRASSSPSEMLCRANKKPANPKIYRLILKGGVFDNGSNI